MRQELLCYSGCFSRQEFIRCDSKITEPLVLFLAGGFRPSNPSSLARIGKHVFLQNGAIVFQRLYFCPRFLFKLITVFAGRCGCSGRMAKREQQRMNEQCNVRFYCCLYLMSFGQELHAIAHI